MMRERERRLQSALRRIVLAAMVGGCSAQKPTESTAQCAPEPVDASDYGVSDSDAATSAVCPAAFRKLPCGLPPDAGLFRCGLSLDVCEQACAGTVYYFCQIPQPLCDPQAGLVSAAKVVIECDTCSGIAGRHPRGFVEPVWKGSPTKSSLGQYFARMAQLEAASVRAFRDLTQSLIRFAAPRELIYAATRARRDERRHARVMSRFARRYGCSPSRARVRPLPAPTLPELLAENLVHGCIRETLGALVAGWQAEHACEDDVRWAFRTIAADETRHAALSWAVLSWGLGRVDRDTRSHLGDLFGRELAALRRHGAPPALPSRNSAGVPSPMTFAALTARLQRELEGEFRHTVETVGAG